MKTVTLTEAQFERITRKLGNEVDSMRVNFGRRGYRIH